MKTAKPRVSSSLPKVPVSRLVGHDGPVQTVRFTADGKYCLTGGHDRMVRLWNPSRLDPAFPPPPAQQQHQGEFVRGQQRHEHDPNAANTIAVENLPRALPIQTYGDAITHSVSAISIDEQNTTLAVASNKTLVVLDVITQKVKRRFQGHLGCINAVDIAKGCEAFLSASYDGSVRIWDGRSRSHEPIQILNEAKDSVTDVQTHQGEGSGNSSGAPLPALIRTASVDGVVRTYDIRKGNIQCDSCESSVTSIASTHDDRCLAISCLDGAIRLMECDTGELLKTFRSEHVAGQYALECCLTANDATVVTGSEDGRVVLYDVVKGTNVQSLEGHTRPTCSIAAHPKREHSDVIISASYDGNAVVWAHEESFMRW